MATVNPPFALQNAGATHTAENDRVAIGALLAGAQIAGNLTGRGGVAPALGGGLAVTPSSGLIVSVAAGVAFVPGNTSIKQGIYICTNDAPVTVTLDTAHATLPRIDNIICRVQDSVYSGANDFWTIEKVTGTPASSPVAPANPPSSITLAQITVAAGATVINSGNIADVRKFISQGVISIQSTQKPAAANVGPGQLISLIDTGEIQMNFGGSWVTKSAQTLVIDKQVFINSGTWTKPANAKSVYVEVVGGGGAGGGSATTGATQASMGSGGGAGGYCAGMFDAASLSATVTVTVGSGGTSISGSDGLAGTGSSFGSLITASGGSGGIVRSASTTAFGVTGGVGGSTFTGGTIQIPGDDGGWGWGDGQLGVSGEGGASYLSTRSRGQHTQSNTQRLGGIAGKSYGGGGAGANNAGSATQISGGAGAKGVVIVTTYF